MTSGQPGRPTLFTQERTERIIQLVAAGNYLNVAARATGIGESTLHSWMARGRDADAARRTGTEPDPTEARFLEFLEAVTRAEGEAEAAAVLAWRSAFKDDWRAARDYLVRKQPDRWAATTRIAISGEESEQRIEKAVQEAMLALGADVDADMDLDEGADLHPDEDGD